MPRSAALIAALILTLAALLAAGPLGRARTATASPPATVPEMAVTSQATARAPMPTPIPQCHDGARSLAWYAPLTFVDPLHGWAQEWECAAGTWQPRLAATTDGGETWQSLRWPHTLSSPQDAHKLRFISLRDGWLLGPPATFVTHDGGVTWTEDAQLDDIVLLESVGDSIWAVRARCGGSFDCDYDLLASSDRGATWAPLPSQPSLRGGRVLPTMPGYQLRLVRTGKDKAWLAWGGDNAPWMRSAGNMIPPLLLFVTEDAGLTWQEIVAPCGEFTNYLAVSNTADVWLLCNRMPGGNTSMKWLYRSADGGSTWDLTGDAVRPMEPGLHNLSIGGSANDRIVVSHERAFIPQRAVGVSALLTTGDGGQHWTAIPRFGVGDIIYQVLFVDEQHGWVAFPDVVWRTTDGGDTWEQLAP